MKINRLLPLSATSIYCLFFAFLLTSCSALHQSSQSHFCATRYPVVLVHGIGYRDDVRLFRYWSEIPEALEKQGANVFLARHDAFGSFQSNGQQLKQRIEEILDETGAEKVNLIGHSKGGLDSRYMISHLGMADKVASLTTIATPHRGAYLANYVATVGQQTKTYELMLRIAHQYACFLGDSLPQVETALLQLTPEYMEIFNQNVPDMPQVYYQSFGGVVNEEHASRVVRFKLPVLLPQEGPGDGTVARTSYEWGNFRGVVKSGSPGGISHLDIVGISGGDNFEYTAFMLFVVNDLKNRGY